VAAFVLSDQKTSKCGSFQDKNTKKSDGEQKKSKNSNEREKEKRMARSAILVAALFALAAAVAGAVSPNYEPETAWQAMWLSKIAYCDPSSITPAWDCDACAGMPNFQLLCLPN
jgi:hypothetical protein